MILLITGGSGSGKSAYAEACAEALFRDCKKYYIATMRVSDSEGQLRVEKHRSMRSGRGFCTIEQPVDLPDALSRMADEPKEARSALLECISNLAANEMFTDGGRRSFREVTEKIVRDVERLNRELAHLVIVTNNVFEDGIAYDEATTEYLKALGSINQRLAALADRVVEVVVGIPIIVKQSPERKEVTECQ